MVQWTYAPCSATSVRLTWLDKNLLRKHMFAQRHQAAVSFNTCLPSQPSCVQTLVVYYVGGVAKVGQCINALVVCCLDLVCTFVHDVV
jgi:hypothetical protein